MWRHVLCLCPLRFLFHFSTFSKLFFIFIGWLSASEMNHSFNRRQLGEWLDYLTLLHSVLFVLIIGIVPGWRCGMLRTRLMENDSTDWDLISIYNVRGFLWRNRLISGFFETRISRIQVILVRNDFICYSKRVWMIHLWSEGWVLSHCFEILWDYLGLSGIIWNYLEFISN